MVVLEEVLKNHQSGEVLGQENVMDGSGKEISLLFNNLATYKQAPYLVRALSNLMPNLKIRVNPNEEDSGDYTIFLKDLERNGVSGNFVFKDFESDVLNIHLDYSNTYILRNNELKFSIDLLKFSERKLLNEDEIKNLKDRYKIRNSEHVVLGGSFYKKDLVFFKNFFNRLSREENFKFVIVPRQDGGELENIFLEEDVVFETEDNLSGNEKYLVISERGVLDNLYSICDVALLGNTFGRSGPRSGQNPLEPAFYGKRMISGCEYSSWNLEAFKGLNQSGLLKVINDGKTVMEEMLRKNSYQDILNQKFASEFIKSWQKMELSYAKIIQKVLYGNLTFRDENFLLQKQNYKDIADLFN